MSHAHINKIANLLRTWMEQGKTGQVEINFREGQIRNYTLRESFLVDGLMESRAESVDARARRKG